MIIGGGGKTYIVGGGGNMWDKPPEGKGEKLGRTALHRLPAVPPDKTAKGEKNGQSGTKPESC